jgi:hypothetical protein
VTEQSDIAWSCVVDDTPAIWSSLIPWLATLFEVVGARASQVHLHHVCELPPDLAELVKALEVHTHAVKPFRRGHPHTNKVRQLETEFPSSSRVVLTDVDLAFFRKPPVETIRVPVAGKLVDAPNPPLHILRRIFAESGQREPDAITCHDPTRDDQPGSFETLSGNFNGGFYVIDPEYIRPLGEAWSRWASWLIDNVRLLEGWRIHVDQVSFCLAVAEVSPDVELLSATWQFPLHLPCLDRDSQPHVLHHHAALDEDGCLLPGALAHAPGPVLGINTAIREFRRKHAIGASPSPTISGSATISSTQTVDGSA